MYKNCKLWCTSVYVRAHVCVCVMHVQFAKYMGIYEVSIFRFSS